MRRGYDIDHGRDKPEENIYPKLNNEARDNNRCHGGSVNSLASGMKNIHKSYEVKVILRSDIEREIQNIYKKIVKENRGLFKGQEQSLRTWTATGKITGDVRQKLQAVFDVSYKQEFEGTYKGYINDNEFQNIILQGLDNVPIPDDLRRKSGIEEMSSNELYQAIKNEKIPLLHHDKERGFESTLSYLASLEGNEDLYEELVALAISENPKEPSVQKALRFLSRSRLPKELKETKVYELKGSSIPLSAIAELNENELSHLFRIDHSQFVEEAARMNLYGLLRLAVKNVELTEDELKSGYSSYQLTLLILASRNGDSEVANLLIENGADVKAVDQYGTTPLHWASEKGHLALAKLCIKKGADVNAKDYRGKTPLRLASRDGRLDLAKLLIDNGADVKAVDQYGETPLNMALLYGYLDLAKLLIENGADVNANRYGTTPLHWASEKGHLALAKLCIEKGADVNAKDKYGETPLHLALEKGRLYVAKLLIENGADVNAVDQYGYTPLRLASLKGHIDVAKLLIEKGADVNAKDKDGYTPLHSASEKGHLEVVKLLIEKGADLNAKDKDGKTPLHLASEKGYLDVAKLLMEKRAEVNAKDNSGATPLHWTSMKRHLEVAKLLIEKGATVSLSEVLNCTNPISKSVLKSGYIYGWKTSLSNVAYNAYKVLTGDSMPFGARFSDFDKHFSEKHAKRSWTEKDLQKHENNRDTPNRD